MNRMILGVVGGVVGAAAVLGGGAILVGAGSWPTPAATAPAADTFTVDGVHSSAVFRVQHQGVSYFWGRFNSIAGTFNIDLDHVENSNVDVTIQAESVDTNNPKRDGHLKTQDFFSVKEFPTLTFKSTSVKKTGEHTFDVTGELTIRGQTKSVTARGLYGGIASGQRGQVSGFEAKFNINRSDFGVTYMSGKGLGEEVQIVVSLEGGK